MESEKTSFWGEMWKTYYWLILICIAAGIALGYALTHLESPEYRATSTILYGPTLQDNVSSISSQLQATQTYNDLLNSKTVAQLVIENLHLSTSPEALSKQVSANVNGTSLVSQIEATAPTPQAAVTIANGYAYVASTYLPTLVAYDNISIVGKANTNSVTLVHPQEKHNVVGGLALGLFAGIGLAAVRYRTVQISVRRKTRKSGRHARLRSL